MVKLINEELQVLEQELSALNDRLQRGRFVEQLKFKILLKEERIDTLYGILNKAIESGVDDKELFTK